MDQPPWRLADITVGVSDLLYKEVLTIKRCYRHKQRIAIDKERFFFCADKSHGFRVGTLKAVQHFQHLRLGFWHEEKGNG